MVKHIVFMKFPDFSLAQIAKDKLLSMKDRVKSLKDIEVGIDFSRSERSFDLALITIFNSKEDLENYRIDPYHQQILKWLKDNNTQTKVVDYEF
ncbi:MAG TPA: Dabb family protein [Campylobacterales bacterium]|nr:Dabb family protein [Campylobacterales bacterium]